MVKTLAASRRMKRAAGAASCSEVNNVATKLTALVADFPSSPDILVFSATIIASSGLVCSAEEKLSLAELDAMFEGAVTTLDTAVEAAQGQLETLTGATASPAQIAEVLAATTVVTTTTTKVTTKTTTTEVTTTTTTATAPTTTVPGVSGPCEGLYIEKIHLLIPHICPDDTQQTPCPYYLKYLFGRLKKKRKKILPV